MEIDSLNLEVKTPQKKIPANDPHGNQPIWEEKKKRNVTKKKKN